MAGGDDSPRAPSSVYSVDDGSADINKDVNTHNNDGDSHHYRDHNPTSNEGNPNNDDDDMPDDDNLSYGTAEEEFQPFR
jgi:hypothetical protein